METYKFINNDCLEELKNIENFPDKSISLIITSPPYNIGIKYNKYADKKPRDQYIEWIYDIMSECKRVLTDDGQLFLNIGYINKDPWIDMEIAVRLKDLFKLQNNITWVKSISISDDANDTHGHFKPINSKRYITPTNEKIFHFTKKGNVALDRLSIGVPYKWKCNQVKRPSKLVKKYRNTLCEELNIKKNELPKNRIDMKKLLIDIELQWKDDYDKYYDKIENYEKNKIKIKPDKRCKGNSWFIPYENGEFER